MTASRDNSSLFPLLPPHSLSISFSSSSSSRSLPHHVFLLNFFLLLLLLLRVAAASSKVTVLLRVVSILRETIEVLLSLFISGNGSNRPSSLASSNSCSLKSSLPSQKVSSASQVFLWGEAAIQRFQVTFRARVKRPLQFIIASLFLCSSSSPSLLSFLIFIIFLLCSPSLYDNLLFFYS